jgi:methylenetetrahydrofolate reductase (NADPH)
MLFYDKLKSDTPTLSYEFFPPKDPSGWGTLYTTLGNIVRQYPDFVSVTYGAGGSTRQKTVELVGRIKSELGIEAMAHLTCVGHSQDELGSILSSLETGGVTHVLALRGDAPKGSAGFTPHRDGFEHATDLIHYTRENFNFRIGCAFYPEKHLESESINQDVQFLKLKQDNGADFAISQLFFDNNNFYSFRDKAKKAGVTLPFIAGIMPVTSLSQLPRFKEMSGAIIPDKLLDFLGSDPEKIVQRGIEYAIEQGRGLLENGVAGLHFYTLNKSGSSVKITQALRDLGYFPIVKPGK